MEVSIEGSQQQEKEQQQIITTRSIGKEEGIPSLQAWSLCMPLPLELPTKVVIGID